MKKHTDFPLFLAACLVLSACAKNTGENYTTYYPECQQPILEMQSQETPLMGAAKGTIGGGLIGGVSGFLLGLLFSGGNVSDAGIGAAVGAASGAISGGISGGFSSRTGNARENMLLAKYYDKIDGDVSGLTVRQAAGTVALQCYQKKLAQVEARQKAGQLSPLAADQRILDISRGIEQARQLIGSEQIAARESIPVRDVQPEMKAAPSKK